MFTIVLEFLQLGCLFVIFLLLIVSAILLILR